MLVLSFFVLVFVLIARIVLLVVFFVLFVLLVLAVLFVLCVLALLLLLFVLSADTLRAFMEREIIGIRIIRIIRIIMLVLSFYVHGVALGGASQVPRGVSPGRVPRP